VDGTACHVAEFENLFVSCTVLEALTLPTVRNDSSVQQDIRGLRDVRLRGLGIPRRLGDALLPSMRAYKSMIRIGSERTLNSSTTVTNAAFDKCFLPSGLVNLASTSHATYPDDRL
jgi:hypothetical protein